MSDTKFIDLIKNKFADLVLDSHNFRGDQTVTVKKDCGNDFFKFLRDEPELAFNFLMDITAVDYMSKKTERFEVVYHLRSLSKDRRIRLKCPVPEDDCQIPSIHMLWDAVNWYERECYDMYGIHFEEHPNLTRILMYEQFQGHPLRKDYPMDKQQPLLELNDVEERYHYGRFE